MNRLFCNILWSNCNTQCHFIGRRRTLAFGLLQKCTASTSSLDAPPKSDHQKNEFYLHSLNIKDQFRPVKKLESFVKRSFFGEIDKDYLDFPNLVASQDEETLLTEQYDFIRRHFMEICSDQQSLIDYGLYDVQSLTTFELVHLFESIGASLNYQRSLDETYNRLTSNNNKLIPIENKLLVTNSFLTSYQQKKTFVQSVVPLLVHNTLVMSAIGASSNSTIKQKLASQSGLTKPGIAFAFCELDDKFTAMPYPYWDSFATYCQEDDTWTVSGTKSRIIKADYDHFVIFCKTVSADAANNESNRKVSDYGIACFVLDRESVKIEDDGTDNYGNQYLKISFKDLVLSRQDHELFCSSSVEQNTKNEPNFALNIKARGQLATSAVIFGMLKESFGNLIKLHQSDACHESILKEQAGHLTEMLYSLESMIYQTATQFDTFDTDGMDIFLQAMTVKTLANEFANEMMNKFRFLLNPHQLGPVMSPQTVNVLNVLDAFLDSATSSRMLLATYGLRSIGTWKFDHIIKMRTPTINFNHFLKYMTFPSFRKDMKQRSAKLMLDRLSLDKLPPSMQESANLLKNVLDEVAEQGRHILQIYGKECVNNQIDMNRFANSVLSAYQMISVISRTNNSLQKKSPTSEQELLLCRSICRKRLRKAKSDTELIYGILTTSEEKRAKAIHKRNMRFDGYFAKPTFDRII